MTIGTGVEGSGNDQFRFPLSVFATGDTLYVADTYNHRIQAFKIQEESRRATPTGEKQGTESKEEGRGTTGEVIEIMAEVARGEVGNARQRLTELAADRTPANVNVQRAANRALRDLNKNGAGTDHFLRNVGQFPGMTPGDRVRALEAVLVTAPADAKAIRAELGTLRARYESVLPQDAERSRRATPTGETMSPDAIVRQIIEISEEINGLFQQAVDVTFTLETSGQEDPQLEKITTKMEQLEAERQRLESLFEEKLPVPQSIAESSEAKRATPTGDTQLVNAADVSALEAAIANIAEAARGIGNHVAIRPALEPATTRLALEDIVIVTKRSWGEPLEGSAEDVSLEGKYRIIIQGLRKACDDLIQVEDQDALVAAVEGIIGQGKKAVVLDDGELTSGLEESRISGQAGKDYCIVASDTPEDIGVDQIRFINLKAMALIGVAVLSRDRGLFERSYELFTGSQPPENLITDFETKRLFIIRGLPRIIRINVEDFENQRKLQELFAVAA